MVVAVTVPLGGVVSERQTSRHCKQRDEESAFVIEESFRALLRISSGKQSDWICSWCGVRRGVKYIQIQVVFVIVTLVE